MRGGACIEAATMLQPWTLRLILNAAALAAASPTLLFRCVLLRCNVTGEKFRLLKRSGPYKNRTINAEAG